MHQILYWFFAGVMVVAASEKKAPEEEYRYKDLQLAFLKSGPEQYCGHDLAFTLCVICMGSYSAATTETGSKTASRRFRRGVVDECCDRPCLGKVLKQYCGPPLNKTSLICNKK